MLIPVNQPSSAVEQSRHPSNVISAVCLSNLSYSLINVSTVATTAVFLNARLNLFMKLGAWMCGQALSSERLLLLIISQRASPSLCLSLSVADMITTAPHQSHGAVICPTFNINMRGCHGGGWQGCLVVPNFFPTTINFIRHLTVTQHSAFHNRAAQPWLIICCMSIKHSQFNISSIQWIQKFLSVKLFWYYLVSLGATTQERLFTANMNWADSITCFHSLGFVHTNPDTLKYVFYVSHCFFFSTSAFCFLAVPNNWKTTKSPTSNSIWYKHGTLLALDTQQDEAFILSPLILSVIFSVFQSSQSHNTGVVNNSWQICKWRLYQLQTSSGFPIPCEYFDPWLRSTKVWVISINNDLSSNRHVFFLFSVR